MIRRFLTFILYISAALSAVAKDTADNDSITTDLDEVTFISRVRSTSKLKSSITNTDMISGAELCRAACCNLGESFTTNPSVDVSYSDAATGSKQIKLLGLSGTYVQMLTENFPNLRGASAPFALNYIPGPWMQSIQVSKGASSVKTGYESVTGQINVEILKPQSENSLEANGFVNHQGKVEGNLSGNIHLAPRLSTGLLLHAENTFETHDNNGDGFADMPDIYQFSGMNRWAYMGDKYVFQAGVKFLTERRRSGQIGHHAMNAGNDNPYLINLRTDRWEAYAKNAFIFDKENNGNVALIVSGSIHDQNSVYGNRFYNVKEDYLYSSLMFEREFGEIHSLSTGVSLNHDRYDEHFLTALDPDALKIGPANSVSRETVTGAYAQYTLNIDTRWLVMAGVRYDHSSIYGNIFTPRLHFKWNCSDLLTVHASAGKGYRTPHALSDNSYLLASSRSLIIDDDLQLEEAWNTGGGLNGSLSLFDRSLTWSAEYYYTGFKHQTVVDLDTSADAVYIRNLQGKSYSHSAQAEITYEPSSIVTVTMAYRYTDARMDYGQGLMARPLVSKSKGLLTINYSPMMSIWQADVTLLLNGGGRMPTPATVDGTQLWASRFKAYPTLNAQVTRNFRKWAVYVGGENLTGYRQKSPIISANDPWGKHFDATMVYGPIEGAMVYAGFRYTLK